MTCACGKHELARGSYRVADGFEHHPGFCREETLPEWWPPNGRPRKPCACGRKETTEKRPTRAQRASGSYHTQAECFALDANGATCLWRGQNPADTR